MVKTFQICASNPTVGHILLIVKPFDTSEIKGGSWFKALDGPHEAAS